MEVAFKRLRAITRTDGWWIFLIFGIAALFRASAVAEPARTVFDETVYANYIVRHIEEVPYIDIHPPLARSLFGTIAGEFPFGATAIEWRTNAPFGDFPYLPLRMTMVFFGTLLPVLLYAIGRGLGLAPPWASIAGILAAIEPGFVIFSRIMVPDMMLLAFGFAGIAVSLAGAEARERERRIVCALVAGALFGAAIAIKWTGLGLLATGVFALLLARRFWSIAGVVGMAAGVYVAAFLWFFSAFPMGGAIEPIVPWLFEGSGQHATITLPGPNDEVFPALIDLHRVMFGGQSSPAFITASAAGDPPLLWPLALSRLPLWLSDDGSRQITLLGNPLLWTLALGLFLLALVALGVRTHERRNAKHDDPAFGPNNLPLVLVAGYLGNYVPFFFIERPMYLYHYFAALCFLFLALPWGIREADELLARVVPSRAARRGIAFMLAGMVIAAHLVMAPWVWGW